VEKKNKVFVGIVIGLVVSIFVFSSIALPIYRSTIALKNVNAAGAGSYVVLEARTGEILKSENRLSPRPIASTTKILTTIVVIEEFARTGRSLDEIVTVPKQAAGVEGSSIYLQAGEEISVRDLLYGLMLQSGNDAAVTLAHVVSGNEETFSELMNKRAKEMGALYSNFVTASGLDAKGQYSCAQDVGIITRHAMQNETFREISACKKYIAEETNKTSKRYIHNKNKLLGSYEGAIGGKTGFTKKAGRCLVAVSEREGMEIISVVLDCPSMWEDSKALMTNAHMEYALVTGLDESIIPSSISLSVEKGRFFLKEAQGDVLTNGKLSVHTSPFASANEANASVGVAPQSDPSKKLVRKNEIEEFKTHVEFKEQFSSKIEKGDVVGEVLVTKKDKVVFNTYLVAVDSVEVENKDQTYWDLVREII